MKKNQGNHFSIKNKSFQSKMILAKKPKNNRRRLAKNGFVVLLSIIDHTQQNFKKMKNNDPGLRAIRIFHFKFLIIFYIFSQNLQSMIQNFYFPLQFKNDTKIRNLKSTRLARSARL
jgi:hypothetical protein